ncbi:Retrotransposon-derived protein peg10 [Entomophthora muscae]|uniref:Retrotransposon-derived protein peg10 n=1 Tax=Entomophthora muscae TaxID=34485 RepID=A0ACC2SGR5_9FUNG|nr:Retrotransposon-derived protein peg10 [Entomophthora muscae]
MHRLTLLLTDLSSPSTLRRSSILQRSSLVTTEIGLPLTQYVTQVSSRTTTSLSVHSYPSLEKTKSHKLPLLLVLQVSHKKFCSLQSRLQASDAEACSFYKIGLNRLLQEFLVHQNLPDKLKPLIREVVKWNQKYLFSKTHPSSNLSPEAWLFIPDKVLLSSAPPLGIKPKSGGGFCLTAKEVLRIRSNNLCSYCGSKDHLLPACPLSKCSPFVNKTSTLTLLSLIDSLKSPIVLVTIHGPLGKIKVLALLNTGADANFIEEKLAKLIGLSASGSLDVKVGKSTIIGATPIIQPVTIDLKGSSFRVTCNSSPNLSFPFILGFP